MKLTELSRSVLTDVWHTMYPALCMACGQSPRIKNGIFCVECLHAMPYTDHFMVSDNKVQQKFYGRIPLSFAASLLSFRPGGIVQNMMHRLKYEGRSRIAITLGEIAAEKCLSASFFKLPDIMIPIPLHPSKELARGYNQSYIFGTGVRKVLDVPLSKDLLIKVTKTASQTGKSRTDRVENVKDTFRIKNTELIKGKNVLLLDDVVTTGATIEAAALKLREAGVGQISLLTLAVAEG